MHRVRTFKKLLEVAKSVNKNEWFMQQKSFWLKAKSFFVLSISF
jgi:hypothetical protein